MFKPWFNKVTRIESFKCHISGVYAGRKASPAWLWKLLASYYQSIQWFGYVTKRPAPSSTPTQAFAKIDFLLEYEWSRVSCYQWETYTHSKLVVIYIKWHDKKNTLHIPKSTPDQIFQCLKEKSDLIWLHQQYRIFNKETRFFLQIKQTSVEYKV